MLKLIERLTQKIDLRRFTGCPYCRKGTDMARHRHFYCSYRIPPWQIEREQGSGKMIKNPPYRPCRYFGPNLLYLSSTLHTECRLEKPSRRR